MCSLCMRRSPSPALAMTELPALSKRHQRLALDPAKHHRRRYGFTKEQEAECRELFQTFDKNGDGEIDKAEFLPMMKALGLNLSPHEVEMFFSRMDMNGDGAVELPELVHFLEGARRPEHEDSVRPEHLDMI